MSTAGETPVEKRSLRHRLYHGETNFDFVGRRRRWFVISLVAVLVGLTSLMTRGLHLGIDFEGGSVWEVPTDDVSVSDARNAVEPFGLQGATIQTLRTQTEGGQSQRYLRVESEPLGRQESQEVTAALAELAGTEVDEVSLDSVGASWGREISEAAIRALAVFLVLVTLYIAVRFELKMAIPTLVALIHDVLITVGVYSLTQFEVTPATVIAMLTILGYSIYDGIVVFDKVDENSRLVSSTGGMSYGGMVNLSLNQALMRSLNTSITALIPVGSLLIVGAWIMGAEPLQEFALALLVGLFSGAYSSIFIASPMLALLKEREPRFRDIRRRVEARDAKAATSSRRARPAATAATAASARKGDAVADEGAEVDTDDVATPVPSGGNGGRSAESASQGDRVIPPRPRKKSKGRRR
jgi:preprotein translocase subunit SecF